VGGQEKEDSGHEDLPGRAILGSAGLRWWDGRRPVAASRVALQFAGGATAATIGFPACMVCGDVWPSGRRTSVVVVVSEGCSLGDSPDRACRGYSVSIRRALPNAVARCLARRTCSSSFVRLVRWEALGCRSHGRATGLLRRICRSRFRPEFPIPADIVASFRFGKMAFRTSLRPGVPRRVGGSDIRDECTAGSKTLVSRSRPPPPALSQYSICYGSGPV
jgi:hypothetical protein